MIRNGWKLSDGKAIWTGRAKTGPQGELQAILITVGHLESPEHPESPDHDLAEARRNSAAPAPAPPPREGLCLKMLMDGAPRAMLDLGGDLDLPLEDFVSQNSADEIAQSALGWVLGTPQPAQA